MKAVQDFFVKLTKETVILTPNRRLSGALHKLYHQYQMNLKASYWSTPLILPINSWIKKWWQDFSDTTFMKVPHILNEAQEQYLWEQILIEKNENHFLLQVSEAALHAKSAWELLNGWRVTLDHPLLRETPDCAAFLSFAEAFKQILLEKNCLDESAIPNELIHLITTGKITPPPHICLYGFSEYSPQIALLFETCEKYGTTITSLAFENNIPQMQKKVELNDAEHEYHTMAHFAKSIWQKNPHAQIGCIVPGLDKNRDRVQQIFTQVFADQKLFSHQSNEMPFNLSAGKRLTDYPVIHAALTLLALQKNNISTTIFREILFTPFIGEAESERIARAKYDRLLRRKNINTINLSDFLQETHPFSLQKHLPSLSKRLTHFLNFIQSQKEFSAYCEWSSIFNEALTYLGWPGERSLESNEYQTITQWLAILTQLATLDDISIPVTFSKAHYTLQKMAAARAFQAKSPDTPIQILGILEALGMPFDYLWMSGMDDMTWPPQPKPNPFLPKRLQRELNMPHATAERELNYCSDLITQFQNNAQQIIFSFAKAKAGLEMQASPLIKNFSIMQHEDLPKQSFYALYEYLFKQQNLETIIDEQGPNVCSEEKVRGGVSVIKQQALCPFRAFAEWRLHAKELEALAPGLKAKDRGTILHKILETLWQHLQTQENLIAASDSDLKQLILNCITENLNQYPHARENQLHYLTLEKKRLQSLIFDWLTLEKTRAPFTVLTQEETSTVTLNQLSLSVKVDRIDELANGQKLIIDYKTGKHNELSTWFGERPEEPQLPIYFLLDPENTDGISFAQITPGEHIFKGVSRYQLEIKGIKLLTEVKHAKPNWQEQLREWQRVLTQLSNDFCSGVAAVQPKSPPQTCTWCHLKPLCRIAENEIK